jgi:anti-sigma regulatory factor (Ser/Thr protein kinase)
MEGITLDSALRKATAAATLEWLANALEHARSNGQTKVVGYLEEVADDIVFEVEMVARRASLVG